MEKWKNWWKTEKRYLTMIKAVLLAFLPLLCCLVYCAMQGQSIAQVYLPDSEWNDELFYYKQVEGIVKYGFPQGYFGFNESRALQLSFAAWSPVLVFPWIIWGLLFGWNLLSPVICNIVLLTLACFLFVWLVKPSWKQLGILTVLFCLYTPFVRYMLSGMPEIICFSLLIVFYGLAANYMDREKTWKLVVLFALSGVLTLMRPYMLLFLLLPSYFWICKKGFRGFLGSAAVMGVVLAVYAAIKHYLGAAYFAPLFFTDWVDAFFEQGLLGGIRYTLGKLYYRTVDFKAHTLQGIRTGLASGAFFAGYLIMLLVLLVQSIRDFVFFRMQKRQGKLFAKEDRKQLVLEVHLTFSFVAMLFALLLMYKLTEGSKHLLTFMAVGIFVISLLKTRYYKKTAIIGAAFAYFYIYMALDPYDYQVPFLEAQRAEQVQQWQQALSEGLLLSEEKAPTYENVVIWTLYDTKGEESGVMLKWQLLYAVPEGFGISCCEPDYVKNHFDTLQSRYIATLSEGEIDKMCSQADWKELYRDADMVLYQRK